MLKVGLVGVGGISGAHIPAWDSMEDAELVALCDIRPERMEKFEGKKRLYTDFDEMLANEKLDILDITLPTYLHADFAVKAMEHGINVICEKPISLNAEDVKRVYGTAERMGVKFMIAHVLRFWPEYEYVKEVYDSGKYGKLLAGSMTRLGSYPKWSWDGWMMDEKRSGLVPFDLHIHDLDYLVYAFGEPKKHTSFRARRPEQDYINAIYEYDDFFITTEASWYASPYPFAGKFRFQFENAIIANEGGLKVYEREGNIFDVTFDTETDSDEAVEISRPKSDAYANEIYYFADCVKNNPPADKVKPEELETVVNILNSL